MCPRSRPSGILIGSDAQSKSPGSLSPSFLSTQGGPTEGSQLSVWKRMPPLTNNIMRIHSASPAHAASPLLPTCVAVLGDQNCQTIYFQMGMCFWVDLMEELKILHKTKLLTDARGREVIRNAGWCSRPRPKVPLTRTPTCSQSLAADQS